MTVRHFDWSFEPPQTANGFIDFGWDFKSEVPLFVLKIDGALSAIRNVPSKNFQNDCQIFLGLYDPDSVGVVPGTKFGGDDGGGGFVADALLAANIKLYGTASAHLPVHRDFTVGGSQGFPLAKGRILCHVENIAYAADGSEWMDDPLDIEGHLTISIAFP